MSTYRLKKFFSETDSAAPPHPRDSHTDNSTKFTSHIVLISTSEEQPDDDHLKAETCSCQ